MVQKAQEKAYANESEVTAISQSVFHSFPNNFFPSRHAIRTYKCEHD
jgi:hypothetical protein